MEINTISIIKKEDCCGCTACFASCPENSIKMIPDYEGFLYPEINNSKCINCGICYDVCLNVNFNSENQNIFACSSKDDSLRLKSSSGGVFSAISKYVFSKNGGVCAVGYSEDYKECLHKIVTNEKELDDLRRAKFVQSIKHNIFNEVKNFLESNRLLLFCGTPCEVGGLKQFLNKEYSNLITCDLICGCVSSPDVYRRYIDFLIKKYDSKVTGVNFKDKRLGWRGKAIAVSFENGLEYYNSILDDDYCVSFHSRYNIRPSCFNCKYRNLERVSDITLGDFWGIEKYNEKLDDNKGLSFVLTNSINGYNIIKAIDNFNIEEMDISLEEYSTNNNWCMHKNPTGMPENERLKFYIDVKELDFDEMSRINLSEIKEIRKKRKLNL